MKTENYVKIGDQYYAKGTKQAKAYAQSMGGLGNTERQPDPIPPLDHRPKAHPKRKGCVDYCIKIVSYRMREADSDNIIAGAKPLRDSVARSLGIDDNDARIRWEYDTITTSGATGTHVIISRL